jgi:hypothetical protein
MTIKIDHLNYKVNTRPTVKDSWDNTEFVHLNLIFSVSTDDAFRDWFLDKTLEYEKVKVILDTERFEKSSANFLDYLFEHGSSEGWPRDDSNFASGFRTQNSILSYLEKFDKFRYTEYFSWCGATQGAINDIRNLQRGINPTRNTDACFLYQILSGLDYLWD